MEWFARLGLLARGVVYATVGVLAFKLALGDGGKATDQQGAMTTIAKQSSGKILLIIVAAGLAAYSAWRLWRAKSGHEDGFKERVASLLSGIFYAGLSVTAVRIVIGAGTNPDSPEDKATGGVLDWPYGRYIVGAVGGVIILEGLGQLVTAVRQSFCEKARTDKMGPYARRIYGYLGSIGYGARFVVFGLIGYFVLKAAIDFDPDEAVALDGALTKVAHQDLGPLLLGLVSAGLLAFALFCFAESRYRRV
jgi:uncharacterized membrane protein YidH (DUF202 family)